jgi:hypothetical protein
MEEGRSELASKDEEISDGIFDGQEISDGIFDGQ